MTSHNTYKVIITALGTMGDLNPLLMVGESLQLAGHEVTVLTDASKRSFVESRMLGYHEVLDEIQWQQFIGHRGLWERETCDAIVYQLLMLPAVAPTIAYVERHHVPGRTLLIGDLKTLGLRIAKEKFALPLVNLHLAPDFSNSFGEDKDPQQEAKVLSQINGLRRQFGLYEPVRELSMHWAERVDLTLNAYPDWFRGWRSARNIDSECVGFIIDPQSGEELSADVGRFLAAGTPPVIFTQGTGMKDSDRFFAVAAEACEQLGLRGVFLCKEASSLPTRLPDSIYVSSYLPLGKLLCASQMIVHHGGVGTCAQALCHGVPQLILPMAFDQFGNAQRVVELGAGLCLDRRELNLANISRMLIRLLGEAEFSERCAELCTRVIEAAALRDITLRIDDLTRNLSKTPAEELLL